MTKVKVASTILSCCLLMGCSVDSSNMPDIEVPIGRDEARKSAKGKLFGTDFLLFGAPKHNHSSAANTNISPTVNGFLWQASLDVLSFTPLAAVDSKGGVIVSDWYTAPETPNERIKVTIYIMCQQLRADGLKVTIHKQMRGKTDWVNANVDSDVAIEIENLILSRARQLRVKSLNK